MEKYLIISGVIIVVVAAALLFVGCRARKNRTSGDGGTGGYTQISQGEAKEMMKKNDGHVIVDVRRQDEYDDGHIPGAILIPNESIGTEKPAQLPDTDRIILVYCRSGRRSKEAARKLSDLGYTNVYEFGGILDWDGETVKSDEAETVRPTCVLVIEVDGVVLYADLENNPSAKEFIKKLNPGSVTVVMRGDGSETAGPLPWELPQSDAVIKPGPGDILLYRDGRIAVSRGGGSRELTRLASVGGETGEKLIRILGDGDASVKFSLEWGE